MTEEWRFVCRVQKQHSSYVCVIPRGVVTRLDVGKGDVLVWSVREGTDKVGVWVLVKGRPEDGRAKRGKGQGVDSR